MHVAQSRTVYALASMRASVSTAPLPINWSSSVSRHRNRTYHRAGRRQRRGKFAGGRRRPVVSTLLQGMSVALFTMLVGAIFHVWLNMCYQILGTGTVNLTNAIIERAEEPEFFATLRVEL